MIHPVGFLSDHVEVLYDLDEEARIVCERTRSEHGPSRTVGTHPRFVSLLRELIAERMDMLPESRRRSVGPDGASHDVCPELCCLPG